MAKLVTTEEEEETNSFLDWDDESLGKLVKKEALDYEDYMAVETTKREAALVILLSEVSQKETDIGVMEVRGVTVNGEPLGDWRITFERIDADALNPGEFGPDEDTDGGSGGGIPVS